MDAQRTVEDRETRPWQSIPKEERDAFLRSLGMRPAESDEPFPHFKAVRTRTTLRSLWQRLFSR